MNQHHRYLHYHLRGTASHRHLIESHTLNHSPTPSSLFLISTACFVNFVHYAFSLSEYAFFFLYHTILNFLIAFPSLYLFPPCARTLKSVPGERTPVSVSIFRQGRIPNQFLPKCHPARCHYCSLFYTFVMPIVYTTCSSQWRT